MQRRSYVFEGLDQVFRAELQRCFDYDEIRNDTKYGAKQEKLLKNCALSGNEDETGGGSDQDGGGVTMVLPLVSLVIPRELTPVCCRFFFDYLGTGDP